MRAWGGVLSAAALILVAAVVTRLVSTAVVLVAVLSTQSQLSKRFQDVGSR